MLRILLIPIVLAAWYATSLSGSVLKPDQPVSRSYSDCLSLLDNNIWLDADRRISLCFYTDEVRCEKCFYFIFIFDNIKIIIKTRVKRLAQRSSSILHGLNNHW